MDKSKKGKILKLIFVVLYMVFIIVSFIIKYTPGIKIGVNLKDFSLDMLKVAPFAFILIGLFEVWIDRKTVEKHFGENSGFKGYFWAIVLASTAVGGLYVAFPVAAALHSKGARLSIVFTYIGAAAVCRIPMTLFEISFLGLKFTLIRYLVSVPLIVLSSLLLERIFKRVEIRDC